MGDKVYIDDENLDTLEMLDALDNCPTAASTACPSPLSWSEKFQKFEKNIAIAITGSLSGSFASAVTGRDMTLEEKPGTDIAVLNSLSTGPALILCIERLKEMIHEGLDFSEIAKKAEEFIRNTNTVFALNSYENLIKAGRMSRTAGFAARLFGIWGIGEASEQGTIDIVGKARGAIKSVDFIINNMKHHNFLGGKVAISQCHSTDNAELLKKKILELWPGSRVDIYPTRGLCSYYAERGGLIVSYI